LPVHQLSLSGKINAGVHNLNWIYEADEAVKQIEIQSSKDGVHFEALAQLNPQSKSFSWKPLTDNTFYYRIRVITEAGDRSYYSNIITLRERGDDQSPVKVMNNIVNNAVIVNADKACSYQLLDGTGRLLQRGQLVTGTNSIDVTTAQKGLLLLHIQGIPDNVTWKLIKQ